MANLRANKITSTEVFETTGSVQFDGDNDYINLDGNASSFATMSQCTVFMWLKTTNSAAQTLMSWGKDGASEPWWTIRTEWNSWHLHTSRSWSRR